MDTDLRPITKANPNAWRKKLGTGLICLVIGVTPFSATYLYYDTRHVTPVDIEASPRSKNFHIEHFYINYPGLYEINYRAQRTLPYRKLSCLLGVEEFAPSECEQPQPKIATSWILRSNGRVISKGRSDHWKWGGSSNDYLDASMGSFESKSGIEYTLDVTIKNDMSPLAAAHPHLIVAIHPSYTEGWAFPALLTLLIAIILAPIGLWKIVAALLARNWRTGPL